MRRDITIAAERRESRGKNEARRLRARGLTPAVVYGAGSEPVAITVQPREVRKILQSSSGHNTIFHLDIQGEKAPVMIVDWQFEPVRGDLLHVDLKRIDLSRKITVKVPVHTKGDARGVKEQGGLLEQVTREIEIECLPNDIPEELVVDVTPLMIGQSIRAGDVPLGENIRLVSPADMVVVHVVALKGAETTAPAEEVAAPAEPEVIKKGKKEEAAEGEKKK